MSALDRGLIPDGPTAAADAAGLDGRHASRYFAARSGGEHAARSWPRSTAAVDAHPHLIAGAAAALGPASDSPRFAPALPLASLLIAWDRVLAGAAFGSEAHRRQAREELGIRSSVTPIDPRGNDARPCGRYRGQMPRRFRPRGEGNRRERVFGQRRRAESAFSRRKRGLGSAVAGRSDDSRKRECFLRALTHNLMPIAAAA